jgi:hypothetical protein
MQVTLRASNGANILVWREDDLFCAQRAEAPTENPQTCLGLDLFEIIAELADLDLESGAQAAEAIELAESAQRQLADPPPMRGAADPPADRLRKEDSPPHARYRAE